MYAPHPPLTKLHQIRKEKINMNFYTLLKDLCLCPSVSGREQKIREKIESYITPLCDDVRTDALGNLIAHKRGTLGTRKILLAAHMDEIGFMITFIEDSGMLRLAPVGGIDFNASHASAVVSEKGVKGVLYRENKDAKTEQYYIDIGAKTKARAEALVSVGDFFVAAPRLERLAGGRVCGRPLDDRIGCAVLIEIAEQLKSTPVEDDVYYVFSVQEEVGCRGAGTAAFAVSPDVALCFDVTLTGDTPAATPMACKLGDGAAVKLKDSSVICNEDVTRALCKIAEDKKIKHQRELLLAGGTDTSSMQVAGAGARVGALSIPTRYIHSQSEMCELSDALACAALTVEYIKSEYKY